jgi:hypothetical protein
LSCTFHVRATVSSECAVKTSSQSFDLVEELEIAMIGGNLRDSAETPIPYALERIAPFIEVNTGE